MSSSGIKPAVYTSQQPPLSSSSSREVKGKGPEVTAKKVSSFLADLAAKEIDSIETKRLPLRALELRGENALSNPTELEKLWSYIMRSKEDPKLSIAASNAMTALNKVKVSFAGKDLSGIQAPFADLSYGNFHRTNFSKANLQGVNFQFAFLDNTLLVGANLKEVEFGQFRLITSDSSHQPVCMAVYNGAGNGESLIAIGNKAGIFQKRNPKIHIWSNNNVTKPRSFEIDFTPRSLAFSRDGKSLISSCYEEINIWDSSSGEPLRTLIAGYLPREEIEKRFSEAVLNKLKDAGCLQPIADLPDFIQVLLRSKVDFFREQDNEFEEFRNFLFENTLIVGISTSFHEKEPLIACTSRRGDVYLWSQSGRLIDFIPEVKAVSNPIFTRDGDHLLITTQDEIKLLNIKTKEAVKTWSSSYPSYLDAILSDDEEQLAAIGFEGVIIWSFNGEKKEPKKILTHLRNDNFHIKGMAQTVAFSKNGELLAVGSEKELQVWSTKDWSLKHYFIGSDNEILDLSFTENDQLLISISQNEEPKIWKLSNTSINGNLNVWNAQKGDLEAHGAKVEKIFILPNGKKILSLSSGILRVWDAATGKFLMKWEEGVVKNIALSPDSKCILIHTEEKAILFDIEKQSFLKTFEREGGIKGVGFLSSGRALIIQTSGVETYKIETNTLFQVLEGKVADLTTYAFSDDRRWLAIGTKEGVIKAWDSDSENFFSLKGAHSTPVQKICFSESSIFSKSESKSHLWIPEENLYYPLNGDIDDARVVSNNSKRYFLLKIKRYLGLYQYLEDKNFFSSVVRIRTDQKAPLPEYLDRPDEGLITMTDDFGRMKSWSTQRGEVFTNDWRISPSLSKIAVHPNQPILATGGDNGMIQIWNPLNGRLLNILWGHSGEVSSLQFSEEGLSLFSGSEDQTLQKWDLKNGISQATLSWRTEPFALVLHGVNSSDAILDYKVESLLFRKESKTDVALGLAWLFKNEEPFLLKPYLLPPEGDSNYFSDIEVKSHNLDQAITWIHDKILGIKYTDPFLEALAKYLPDLFELCPKGFHFILKAIQSISRSIQDNQLADPVCLHLLLFVDHLKASKNLRFERELLDQKLGEVIARLLKINIPFRPYIPFQIFKRVGDVFLEEGNSASAIICYSKSIEINPATQGAHFKRAQALLMRGLKDRALADLKWALIFDKDDQEIRKQIEALLESQNLELS